MKDSSPPVDAKQRSVPVYWIIGLFVFVNTMICYFDRVNFSVAAPAIMKHFNWDIGIMGLAMSMFGVGYILTQIPAGLLERQVRRKKSSRSRQCGVVVLYAIDAICRHSASHVSGQGTVGPG